VLQRADEPQRLAAVHAVGDGDLDQRHLARGHGARLVEHDRVHAAGGLEDLGALDQQAELGAAAGADHQRRGRRETERTGAGDDQDRDGGGEREARALAGAQPEAERGDREEDDDRHEDARDAVGEALHRRLAGLRVLDEPRDLGQGGVGADLRGAYDQAAAGVDGGAGDLRPRRDLDRDRLAREHAHVDRARALLDDAVGGDLLARTDHEAVADGELLDGDAALAAAGVEDRDVLGAELEQRLQRGAGAALGLGLEVAPGEQEGGDDPGRLEVDLVGAFTRVGDDVEGHAHVVHAGVADEQRVQRPQPRGQRADRDQRVHRGGAVLEIGPRGLVERQRRPQHHGRDEVQRQPLEVVELQRRDHRQQQRRDGERGGEDQAAPQRGRLVLVGLRGLGQRRLVAGGLDRRHELLRARHARVELDPGLLGGVVHRRGDALELVEPALDAVRARGAGHARDRKLDTLDRRGAHRVTSWVNAAVCRRPSVVLNCRNRR
jgi:hypothetical protein